jgi:hypothetical protein
MFFISHRLKTKAEPITRLWKLYLILSLATILIASCTSYSGVQAMGQDTFIVTRQAATGFFGAGTLKAEAIYEAEAYCRSRGKMLKVVSVTEAQPPFLLGNFPKAEVVFKALDPGNPELEVPSEYDSSGTQIRVGSNKVNRSDISVSVENRVSDDLYSKLEKLDELRKKGILTEEEFQAEKERLLKEQK